MPSEALDREGDQAGAPAADKPAGARPTAERTAPSPAREGEKPTNDRGKDHPSDDKPSPAPKPTWGRRIRQHPFIAGAIVLLLVAALVGAVVWWLNARLYESTDDAFIDARTV